MDDVGKLKVLLGAVVLTFALAYFLGGVSLEFPYWLGTTTTTTTSTTSTTTSTSTTTTTLVEIKTFTDNGGAVETKNGKPVVRMYSTTWCPHCRWVKDAYETTVKEYVDKGEVIAYHWELDIDDDTLRPEKIPVPQSEKNLFKKFNPRGGGEFQRSSSAPNTTASETAMKGKKTWKPRRPNSGLS